jgi:hypothetical protein
VDLLCENALAIALEYRRRGMDLSIGYAGGSIVEGDPPELAAALACPAAYPAAGKFKGQGSTASPDTLELPEPPANRSVLVLALPRTLAGGALDRFLKKRSRPGMLIDLAFLYGDDTLAEAAETCVRLYRRGGVHARQIRLGGSVPFMDGSIEETFGEA